MNSIKFKADRAGAITTNDINIESANEPVKFFIFQQLKNWVDKRNKKFAHGEKGKTTQVHMRQIMCVSENKMKVFLKMHNSATEELISAWAIGLIKADSANAISFLTHDQQRDLLDRAAKADMEPYFSRTKDNGTHRLEAYGIRTKGTKDVKNVKKIKIVPDVKSVKSIESVPDIEKVPNVKDVDEPDCSGVTAIPDEDMSGKRKKSGKPIDKGMDRHGSYFETKIYHMDAMQTAKNLRAQFTKGQADNFRMLVKHLSGMMTRDGNVRDPDEYKLFTMMEGISDGDIRDIQIAGEEENLSVNQLSKLFCISKQRVEIALLMELD